MVTILVCQTRIIYVLSICILGNHLKLCSHHLDPFNRSTGQPFFCSPVSHLSHLRRDDEKTFGDPKSLPKHQIHGIFMVKPMSKHHGFYWIVFLVTFYRTPPSIGKNHMICFPMFRFRQKPNDGFKFQTIINHY